jgi:hypothetical protein
MKQMYVANHTPTFRFDNAIALQQSSDGLFPFRQHTAGDIDWGFVRLSLNRDHKNGAI